MITVIHAGFPQNPSSKRFWGTTNSRTLSMCLYPDVVNVALIGKPIMGKISEIKFYYVEFISSILNMKDC